ncbi:MAG: amidohydrolase family protein [Acidobacteriota bacterium]
MRPPGELGSVILRGARCATGPQEREACSLELSGGRIVGRVREGSDDGTASRQRQVLDLSGFLVLPGLINAHDHLEFSLYPRLASPPYRNYIEWGVDIHNRFPEIIATHRAVPKEVRIGWGGIRNLLCGATTVSHHNPLRPEMLDAAFPVRVIRDYGWAHSPALGGDVRSARTATPEGAPFLIHACEGTDDAARDEIWALDRQGLLDASTVLVHGLALNREGIARLIEQRTSLIACPSSNQFLYGTVPDLAPMQSIPHLALGNDSPLTAEGDLLDEIRFAIRSCGITPEAAWTMVTDAPAAILRLRGGEGSLRTGSVGDLVVVRDTGETPASRLSTLRMEDVELVIIGGRVQLASPAVLEKLPDAMRSGLEPLCVDGMMRWLRAPVSYLIRRAEEVLGAGQVRMDGRLLTTPEPGRGGHAH